MSISYICKKYFVAFSKNLVKYRIQCNVLGCYISFWPVLYFRCGYVFHFHGIIQQDGNLSLTNCFRISTRWCRFCKDLTKCPIPMINSPFLRKLFTKSMGVWPASYASLNCFAAPSRAPSNQSPCHHSKRIIKIFHNIETII
jgi:hypothetical protein